MSKEKWHINSKYKNKKYRVISCTAEVHEYKDNPSPYQKGSLNKNKYLESVLSRDSKFSYDGNILFEKGEMKLNSNDLMGSLISPSDFPTPATIFGVECVVELEPSDNSVEVYNGHINEIMDLKIALEKDNLFAMFIIQTPQKNMDLVVSIEAKSVVLN